MAPSATEMLAAYQRGREAWPTVPLTVERFQAHALRLGLQSAPLAANAADLYLVAAVLEGEPGALAALDAVYMGPCCTAVSRIDKAPAFHDDVRQQLRLKLLTGSQPALG